MTYCDKKEDKKNMRATLMYTHEFYFRLDNIRGIDACV